MKFQTFTYPFIVKETYLDSFSHVNNATYFMLFEEARWDLITSRGFGLTNTSIARMAPSRRQGINARG